MTSPDSDSPLIVYVDDEHANRIVFEHSLRGEFNIKTVESGAAALAILDSTDVAVVVTDMRMPEMTGEELLRIIMERSPQTLRMVITAYADVDPILRAINDGLVARYILKPWTRAELVQVLRWAVEAWTFGRDSAALNRRLLETERLATLGSIAGAIAHDLKQPLSALDLNTKRLDELTRAVGPIQRALAGEATPPEEKELIEELITELAELSFDIRAGAIHLRGVAGTLSQFLQPPVKTATSTDAVPVIRHAMAVCQELSVKARGSIVYEGPATLPRVRISPTELTQVLINVLTNAVYAIAAKSSGGRGGGRVALMAAQKDQALVIEVRDDGVGMTPDVLARVGTPFFTTRAEGTGLGISQCQRLIGGAGGRFHIASVPGQGTTVSITIPIIR